MPGEYDLKVLQITRTSVQAAVTLTRLKHFMTPHNKHILCVYALYLGFLTFTVHAQITVPALAKSFLRYKAQDLVH